MKILMIGATGKFAGLVLPQLKKQAHHVTALVQDGNKGQQAITHGADEFVTGDLYDPVTLKKAAEGIDGIFHIIPAFNREVEAGLNMVIAAQEAGVSKFVSPASITLPCPYPTMRKSGQRKRHFTTLAWITPFYSLPCICRCCSKAGRPPKIAAKL
ncbi:SDR family oxidoreductase [Chitinophaga sp. RCC_12]|uniref:SDR family oxidoreductase n=1 Tax=Chitinophaga sp. RCC_12 TaxID=3239226 RepID=UPI003524D25D